MIFVLLNIMNNLDFLLEICEPAKNLLELLKDLYDDVNHLNDDKLPQ